MSFKGWYLNLITIQDACQARDNLKKLGIKGIADLQN
jgi:hypothetical protein